jgi:hypothetical protein
MKSLIRHKKQNQKITYIHTERIYNSIDCPHLIWSASKLVIYLSYNYLTGLIQSYISQKELVKGNSSQRGTTSKYQRRMYVSDKLRQQRANTQRKYGITHIQKPIQWKYVIYQFLMPSICLEILKKMKLYNKKIYYPF